jgi:hypothetical protein
MYWKPELCGPLLHSPSTISPPPSTDAIHGSQSRDEQKKKNHAKPSSRMSKGTYCGGSALMV